MLYNQEFILACLNVDKEISGKDIGKIRRKIKHYSVWKLPGSRQPKVLSFSPERVFQSEIVIVWKDKRALLFFFSQQSSTLWWALFSGSLKCEKGLFRLLWSLPLLSRSFVCKIAKAVNCTRFPIQVITKQPWDSGWVGRICPFHLVLQNMETRKT